MNVLFLANHLNPGGITSYCMGLAEGMVRKGHRAVIVSGGGSRESECASKGIVSYRLPLNTSSEFNPVAWGVYPQLEHIVRSEKIDVIHTQTRLAQLMGSVAAKRCRAAMVFTCHGFLKQRWLRSALPLWGNRVIAISGPVLRHLTEDWKVSPGKIDLVRHGTAFRRTVEERKADYRAVRDQYGWGDRLVIGAVGRLSPVKGYDVLVRAMALVAARDEAEAKRAVCVIFGQGPQEKELRDEVRRLGVEDRVSIVTSETQAGPGMISGFDIFCAPSLQEGFGLSILEAMARGRAIVASRTGGIPDLISGPDEGMLVGPGDEKALAEALIALLQDAPRREALGTAAVRAVQSRFDEESMIEKTLETYRKAMKR